MNSNKMNLLIEEHSEIENVLAMSTSNCSDELREIIESNTEIVSTRRQPDGKISGVDVWLVKNSDGVYLSKDMTLIWEGAKTAKYIRPQTLIMKEGISPYFYFCIKSDTEDLATLYDKLGVVSGDTLELLRVCVSPNGEVLHSSLPSRIDKSRSIIPHENKLSSLTSSLKKYCDREVKYINIPSETESSSKESVSQESISLEASTIKSNVEEEDVFSYDYISNRLVRGEFMVINIDNSKHCVRESMLCKIVMSDYNREIRHKIFSTERLYMPNLTVIISELLQRVICCSFYKASVKLVMYIYISDLVYCISLITDDTCDTEMMYYTIKDYFNTMPLETNAYYDGMFSFIYSIEEADLRHFTNSKETGSYYRKPEDSQWKNEDIFTFSEPYQNLEYDEITYKHLITQSFIDIGIKFPLSCSLDKTYACSGSAMTMYEMDDSVVDTLVSKRSVKSFEYYYNDNTVPRSLAYIAKVINEEVIDSNCYNNQLFIIEVINFNCTYKCSLVKLSLLGKLSVRDIKALEAAVWSTQSFTIHLLLE